MKSDCSTCNTFSNLVKISNCIVFPLLKSWFWSCSSILDHTCIIVTKSISYLVPSRWQFQTFSLLVSQCIIHLHCYLGWLPWTLIQKLKNQLCSASCCGTTCLVGVPFRYMTILPLVDLLAGCKTTSKWKGGILGVWIRLGWVFSSLRCKKNVVLAIRIIFAVCPIWTRIDDFHWVWWCH